MRVNGRTEICSVHRLNSVLSTGLVRVNGQVDMIEWAKPVVSLLFCDASCNAPRIAIVEGMSSTVKQITNAAGFPKPAELIEIIGASALEAQDRAVLNVLYQHAHDSGHITKPGAKWEIPAVTLRTSRHESNDRLGDTLMRLMQVIVSVPYTDPATGDARVLSTHLFRFFDRSAKGVGVVRFGIPEELGPVLAASGRWGRIKAETVCAMTSKYAIALYEMVQLRAGMDNCVETFPLGRFRDLMGVPEGSYERGNDFARFVLDAAAVEVNGLSDFGVQLQAVRRHSKAPITAVTMAWWRKEAGAFRATLMELRQPKLGRKARLQAAQSAAAPAGATSGKRGLRGVAPSAKPRRPASARSAQLDLEDAIKDASANCLR